VDGGSVGEEEEDEESVLKESSALDGFDRSSSWVGTGTGVGFVGESEPMFQKCLSLPTLFGLRVL
jgi:hypothetical protein